jgi:hypothetical protein
LQGVRFERRLCFEKPRTTDNSPLTGHQQFAKSLTPG